MCRRLTDWTRSRASPDTWYTQMNAAQNDKYAKVTLIHTVSNNNSVYAHTSRVTLCTSTKDGGLLSERAQRRCMLSENRLHTARMVSSSSRVPHARCTLAVDWSPNEYNIYTKSSLIMPLQMWMNLPWNVFKSSAHSAYVQEDRARILALPTYDEHFCIVSCVWRRWVGGNFIWFAKKKKNEMRKTPRLCLKFEIRMGMALHTSPKRKVEKAKKKKGENRKQNDRLSSDIGRVLPFNAKIVIMCSMRCSILSRQFRPWNRNTRTDLSHSLQSPSFRSMRRNKCRK